MAIEQLIKQGDKALQEKDYLEAISFFNNAIKENSKAFLPYLKRATAYQKLSNYDSAKKDISVAYSIAEDRGNRSEMGACYFRLAIVYYGEKKLRLALKHFEKALAYNCTESTLDFWKTKCAHDIKEGKGEDTDEEEFDSNDVEDKTKDNGSTPSTTAPESSSNPAVIDKHAPLVAKIRDDWYQSNETVTITIYAKNVKKESCTIQFEPRSVAINFPSANNSEYNYNLDPLGGEIDTEKSSYRIFGTKIEVYLTKKASGKWASLESSTTADEAELAYPSSSKKAINWANFKVDEEEEEEKDGDFFEKLYKDVDDDTRRAMMKSYVQSNGTVLTTNWDEAKAKDFETSPPEGMQAKKWT
ncbi:CS-domain-containing protein [Suhomyces tanzawaensis NRRL Y-17324]|uniref:CS-domain-containing protein n=1 Tax=Suhomyces tanzawaensis NRRL Y-17324 TaxID=984487 RepID=A0A1E4SSK1_9ASCO|nr:CS-domain-containing protein [Suhomyces tanzawaensis NRRL Y-17324]ODV82397.1 CS-domain-containing protein [Suhomyces tanzawaensis NRRL Y-17324]